MNKTSQEEFLLIESEFKTKLQVFSLLTVLGLLLLTSYGNAGVMFFTSLGAIVVLTAWYLAVRKLWLALLSITTFGFAAFFFARSLF